MTFYIPVFKKGNNFAVGGSCLRFETPEILWTKCCEYFEWVKANPLIETKPMIVDKCLEMVELPKMRAMTIKALCIHLGVSRYAWKAYLDRDDYKEVCELVEDIIYTQKFEGAAADLVNPVLIARDLGLKDSQDHTVNGAVPVDGDMKVEVIHVNAENSNNKQT